MNFDNITWSWVEMCGPGGLVPWYPSKHDIGACFQDIFLQVPVQVIFAIVSAYHYGIRSQTRSNMQYRRWTLRLRLFISFLIAVLPVVEGVLYMVYPLGSFRPVDYLTSGVTVVAWFIHAGYVHSLRNRPSVHGPVLVRVLWTLTAALSVINLRSLILNGKEGSEFAYGFGIALVVLQVCYGLTFCTYCFQSTETNENNGQYTERSLLLGSYYQGFREDLDPEYLGVAMEETSIVSKVIFYWLNALIAKGAENKLRTCEDLYDLPSDLSASNLCMQLHGALGDVSVLPTYSSARNIPPGRPVSLLRALHKCFAIEFYSIGVLKLLADILNFAGPILLNLLVTFIEERTEEPSWGYVLAGCLFLTTLFGAFFNVHFSFLMSQVGLKFRGSLISMIYRKTLNVSYSAINSFSVGEIINFMSTDTERIVNSCPSFHSFWSIPLQIIVSFYLLYQQVGVSFLAGVAFTVVLIPINKLIATKIGSLSTQMMDAKDKRVSSMTEILKGARVLKLHVWEEHFMAEVLGIRTTELKYLKSRKYLDALCVYFWASTPVLVAILTLSTYVLLGNEMTAATVFTTVALLNMLIAPLNAFPWVLNGLMEAWVSVKRIQRLLDVPNMELRDYYTPGNQAVNFENCSVEWEPSRLSESEEHALIAPNGLHNISLQVEKGQLIGVIGNVGSGKSTLLHAILAEVYKSSGDVTVQGWEGGFAFVTQSPWIQRGSIRENILFGKSYDSGRYKAVLDGCCLSEDISVLMGGDMARVGEAGTTLSGGQRARVSLARAVYQDKDTYLLDDILSALDPGVARQVYSKVVCGLLKGKTRILCTNNVQFLTNADVIIQLENGQIKSMGKPSEVLGNDEDLACGDTESMVSYKESREELEEGRLKEDEEDMESGAVRGAIYQKYGAAAGIFITLTIFISLILMQASRNVTDYWLSIWVSASNVTINEATTQYYLLVYVSLAVSNTFFTLFRAFLFAYGGIRAAKAIHEKLLKRVLHSKSEFFDNTPLGRILNRFSSDTYTVDDSLPFITNILFAQVVGLIGSMAITIYGLPWLCLLIAPLVPMYHYLQTAYRQCSRELKRLSCVTLSPLYSHYNETLQGLVSIRAYRSLSRFQQRNEELLEYNQRAIFAGYAVNTWLALRLQMMGVLLVTGVALVAVVQHQFDVVAPALVGLTIAYALSITGLLSGVVSAFAETEREFVALERVAQYIDEIEVEPETGHHPPYAWPGQGVISFQSVYMKYGEHLAPSLNGISFETRPAEKIGVVGRTGAGKSSLIAVLVRLMKVSSGQITVDTVNINHIHLQGLRSRIAVIPQDPYLFQGSLRENLDPLVEYRDPEIINALEKCQVKTLVDNLGGLGFKVEAGGRNLSHGQRQLLCLARAVLKSAKIVCIDEATASVDQETDRCIQTAIRSCFRQSTVLTIAHRISTVMDSDRLLVLRNGEVVEFDTPDNLVSDSSSYFYKLSQKSK